jgi:hypothetical protein
MRMNENLQIKIGFFFVASFKFFHQYYFSFSFVYLSMIRVAFVIFPQKNIIFLFVCVCVLLLFCGLFSYTEIVKSDDDFSVTDLSSFHVIDYLLFKSPFGPPVPFIKTSSTSTKSGK